MLELPADDPVRARLRSAAIDHRNGYVGRDGSGALLAFPSALAVGLEAEALRPHGEGGLSSPLEPMRREPAHASEMISEVREGERLLLLLERNGWWLVQGEDGYVGWVHSWVITTGSAAGKSTGAPSWRYGRPRGTIWSSDHYASGTVVRGTPLLPVDAPVQSRGDQRLLATPSGAEGWLHASELATATALESTADLLNVAREFIGTPYRWGGRSPLGFDCSGFVQYLAGLAGARLFRDASQQALQGEGVDLDPMAWAAGDLLFFGDPVDHVGIYDGRSHLVHCQGKVRVDALRDLPHLMPRLSAVRRWWPLRGVTEPTLWIAELRD